MKNLKFFLGYIIGVVLLWILFYFIKKKSFLFIEIFQKEPKPFFMEPSIIIASISFIYLLFSIVLFSKKQLKKTSDRILLSLLLLILLTFPNFNLFKIVFEKSINFNTVNSMSYFFSKKEKIENCIQFEDVQNWKINKIVTSEKDTISFIQNPKWEDKIYSVNQIKTNFMVSQIPFTKFYLLSNLESKKQ